MGANSDVTVDFVNLGRASLNPKHCCQSTGLAVDHPQRKT